jgi:hypothetical protein
VWSVTSGGLVTNLKTNFPSIAADSLTVTPVNTNLDKAITNLYSITALSDANCTANGGLGDLPAAVAVVVNPRPSATISGNTNVCDGGSAVVSAALYGIGPWNVTWSSNGVAVTHPNVAVSTDTLMVSNLSVSFPTNTFFITNLTDANCVATSGDLAGPAVVTVGQAFPATLAIGTDGFWATGTNLAPPNPPYVTAALASNQNLLISAASDPSGTNVQVGVQFNAWIKNCKNNNECTTNNQAVGAAILSITTRVMLGGAGPWQALWSVVSADTSGANASTNSYLSNYVTATNFTVFSFFIPTNSAGTNFTFSLLSISNSACGGSSNALPQPIKVTVNGLLNASLSVLGPDTICNHGTAFLLANLGGGATNVVWWDNAVSNVSAGTSQLTRSVTLSNNNPTVLVTNVYIRQLTGGGITTNLTAVAPNLAVVTVETNPCTNLLSLVPGTLTPTNLTLGWQGNFYLQYNTDLSTTNWHTVTQQVFSGTNLYINQYATNYALPQEYFRLKSAP